MMNRLVLEEDDVISLMTEGYDVDEIAQLLDKSKASVLKIITEYEDSNNMVYYLKLACNDLSYRNEFAKRVFHALSRAGILDMVDVLTEEELLDIPGIGTKGAELIVYAVNVYGIHYEYDD